MRTIKVVFHFDTQTEVIPREEIEGFLVEETDYIIEDFESLSDHELLAILNENGIDAFFENGSWTYPEAIRCDVEESE